MEHIVSSCDDCLFCDHDSSSCNHPKIKHIKLIERDDAGDLITPDWCPLIKELIIIIKK